MLAAAPVSHAAYDKDLYDSLLKKIYRSSSDGDATDIYKIIRKALEQNPAEGDDLTDALIKTLQNNLDRLHEGVSKKDLRHRKKQLHNWVDSHRNDNSGGSVTKQESGH